jgi:hypothetical protein
MSSTAWLLIVLLSYAAGFAASTRGSTPAVKWWIFSSVLSVSFFTALITVGIVQWDAGRVFVWNDWLFQLVLFGLLIGLARCVPKW